MASHMGVQTFATERNSEVEFLILFIITKFCTQLSDRGRLTKFKVVPQKPYISDIASDIWDHFVEAIQLPSKRPLQLWCQTTCYKGNGTGKPEANKTYEVRETLVEGISVRQLTESITNTDVRTIHFTVGDSNYTYQWFLSMKAASYDISVYLGRPGYDIFQSLHKKLKNSFTEDDMSDALEKSIAQNDDIGVCISETLNSLFKWFIDQRMEMSPLASQQWKLVASEMKRRSSSWPKLSSIRGGDIKGRVNNLLFNASAEECDRLIPKTAAQVLKKKPFLSTAIDVVSDWPQFIKRLKALSTTSDELGDFLRVLWNMSQPFQLITRRILLRIHTDESIAYVQDREIGGISEHNLYSGIHTVAQVSKVCSQVSANLRKASILTPKELVAAIETKGKRIINEARWFEAKNGTQLKPSFEYVELALQAAGFQVLSPKAAGINVVGYHSEISPENVQAYTNIKVVRDKSSNVLCILKAKYFRIQEFPRRCKEEAFVGLTLKYKYNKETFVRRLKVPTVMFIDMAADCTPPEHAIKRLISFGWEVVFSIDELIVLLQNIKQ